MAMNAIDVAELTTEQRLGLLEHLWESLSREPEALPLTSAQRRDLDERLDELERNGPDLLTSDDVARAARGV
jgi:putative addiction module component (TIGR02574 family)